MIEAAASIFREDLFYCLSEIVVDIPPAIAAMQRNGMIQVRENAHSELPVSIFVSKTSPFMSYKQLTNPLTG